ncbi:toll-like receptor 2 [Patella vulgata]|uniref:toll-like receptor 2 n=1 Tax=Patella vulgata TaxID=6465 RepID=UPI0024A8C3BA|nr:toll-like receptor 2 [Patella vulgata]
MWRYRPKQLLDIAEKHFVHDAFVAYCVDDGDWVLHDLLPIVEEGENIKLCIHERDFLGGQLIIDNIVQHMENSRKVLVVLSNNFAKSKWCQFEMSLAQKLVIDRSIESIVVVLLQDIEAVNMSKSLNALLKTTTYIKWQDNDNKDIFCTSLQEPRPPNLRLYPFLMFEYRNGISLVTEFLRYEYLRFDMLTKSLNSTNLTSSCRQYQSIDGPLFNQITSNLMLIFSYYFRN